MSKTPISCVVGLGNPGPKYQDNRHNVGFWLVDALARQYSASWRSENKFGGDVARISTPAGDCWLLKPMTYMNHSGRSVGALARFYRLAPEQILVVHDELDMQPGVLRLKSGGGHGGHNGLRDIVNVLGSRDFLRARVGIGHPGDKHGVSNYVLSRPAQDEQIEIERALDRMLDHWLPLQGGDLQGAMQALHSSS